MFDRSQVMVCWRRRVATSTQKRAEDVKGCTNTAPRKRLACFCAAATGPPPGRCYPVFQAWALPIRRCNSCRRGSPLLAAAVAAEINTVQFAHSIFRASVCCAGPAWGRVARQNKHAFKATLELGSIICWAHRKSPVVQKLAARNEAWSHQSHVHTGWRSM